MTLFYNCNILSLDDLTKYPYGVYKIYRINKQRTEGEYKKLMNRLNRIEGQIRGIKGMLEKDAYCTDILVQVAAVNSALNSFNKELLAEHIRTCVIEDIKAGKEDTVDDLVDTIKKLMK